MEHWTGRTNTIRSTDCSLLYFRRSLFILLQGWNIGQGGPTLLDLQIVANCTLEEASLFFTAIATGYLVSAFVVSVTFDRFDKFLHIIFGNIGVAAVMATIPWSSYYELMLTMHVLKGFTCGFADAGKFCRNL